MQEPSQPPCGNPIDVLSLFTWMQCLVQSLLCEYPCNVELGLVPPDVSFLPIWLCTPLNLFYCLIGEETCSCKHLNI